MALPVLATLQMLPLEAAPEKLIDLPIREKFGFERVDLEALQLGGLRKRFDDLVERIPMLRKLAQEQGLDRVTTLEDGVRLLFPHTFYKSYPLSVLDRGRFDALTRWLDTLTAFDLSGLDAKGIDGIDGWIDFLDANTQIRIRHSSGTTGKLSFTPMSTTETYWNAVSFRRMFSRFANEPDSLEEGEFATLPHIGFSHRHGAQASARALSGLVEHVFGGDESRVLALWPTRISADLLSLGGRLAGARARGEHGQVQIPAALLARREAAIKEQAEAPQRLKDFCAAARSRFGGQRVTYRGILPVAVEAAVRGIEMGFERLFAGSSVGGLFGGSKGRSMPDNYETLFARFMGTGFPQLGYGMSESVASLARMCTVGHYHVQPNIIPYLMHPSSGELLPRSGRQRGRYGFFDLGCTSRWGGYITGDAVTLVWGDQAPCACGRKGAYFLADIQRLSEEDGGDDKITCSGAPDMHDKALDFIVASTGG
jgi:hypothetical protein